MSDHVMTQSARRQSVGFRVQAREAYLSPSKAGGPSGRDSDGRCGAKARLLMERAMARPLEEATGGRLTFAGDRIVHADGMPDDVGAALTFPTY